MDTGNTVTDGQDTSSLGEAVLLLDTADPLLQNGGNLGGGGLRIGGVGSDGVGERGSAGLWADKRRQYCTSVEGSWSRRRAAQAVPSTKLHCGANGIGYRFWRLLAMAGRAAGAIAGGCDGLTDAILLVAEIAATRRLDWRMALENMAAAAQESNSEALQPIEIDAGMEEGRW